MNIRPAAGKIAVRKLDLTQELDITTVDGKQIRLAVIASDNHEGVVAEVIATCKPWATASSPEHIFNPEYEKGEIVVIGKWTGTRLNIDREEFIILREEDILCSLDKKPSLNAPVVIDAETMDDEGDKSFDEMIGAATPQV